MTTLYYIKEFLILTVSYYLLYFTLYFIVRFRINKIMNDNMKVAHIKSLLYFPLLFLTIFLTINIYHYAR